jgi:hypothetical protein
LKELIRLLPVEGQPTRAVLEQTWMGVFFISSVPDTIFSTFFRPRPPADRRWSANHSLKILAYLMIFVCSLAIVIRCVMDAT